MFFIYNVKSWVEYICDFFKNQMTIVEVYFWVIYLAIYFNSHNNPLLCCLEIE